LHEAKFLEDRLVEKAIEMIAVPGPRINYKTKHWASGRRRRLIARQVLDDLRAGFFQVFKCVAPEGTATAVPRYIGERMNVALKFEETRV